MSGRARTRARGQRRSPSPGEVGPLQVEAPRPSTNLHEQESEGAPTTDPQGGPGPALRAGEGLVEGAGDRKLRRHSLDLAVHTRERLAHVRDSKAGCSGVPVKLVANFFSLELPQDWQLFQYHVTFHPDVESRRLRTALLYGHSQLSSRAKAFDGVILFLSQELGEKVTELSSVTQRGEIVQMTLTLTRQLPASSPVCMQVFNLIFRKILRKLSLYQIGRNFYNPSQPVEIPQHKLSLWPGFAISVSQFENSLLLHADVCYKILRNETVLELMAELCHRDNGPCFTQACEEQLIGLVVLTRYNNRTYRVDDIDWSVKPTHTFQKRDGTRLSYMEYYKQQYDITVSDLGQPMLVSQLRRKGSAEVRLVHLLPELCFLTEVAAVHVHVQGRSYTASEEDAQGPSCLIHVQKGATQGDVCGLHNLMVLAWHPQMAVQGLSSRAGSDFPLMKAVTEEMRLGPMGRQQRLAQLADDIQRNKDTRFELETWGLHLGCQLSMTGRVVPTEKMILQDRICQPVSAADWSKDMQTCKLLSTKSLNNWLILCSDRIECVTESFLGCLRRAGSSMGFNIQHPKIIKIQENPAAFLRAIQRHSDPNVQLVMCILPSNNKSYYDSIKKYLSSDCPVPSQCIRARTLHRPGMLMSVATKVALQLTCKLGGELWAVEIPLKSLMVVGIALCKDALSTGMTVVGFVASMNPGITRWFSRCILQRTTTEVADCLKAFMSGALNKWYEANHILPARIIVYRSGVGDGQLQTLIDYELPQLLSSVTASGSQTSPRLSVVVVRTKCSTRFFTEMSHTVQNPPLGTVVDSEATRPNWYDFYLVSQAAHRGTVSPTYYNVIYDDNGLKPDHMQRLTFKLCHLYYNWPGLVRMPAPCQYAHKLTFLVAQSIHKEPSLELANSLFYL